jgi:pSer/pThr/pTyr-binding forkhead associated (FHA) protein
MDAPEFSSVGVLDPSTRLSTIILPMPILHCPKCGQAYDVPGVVAVRLPQSIATCACGEWLSGSKAAILARLVDPSEIREIDMKPYRIDPSAPAPIETAEPGPLTPRSVRIVARGAHHSINTVFTIYEHPLWIGRKGCHVELPDGELSIRHCSISVRGSELVVRDADSHTGTFLDGQQVDEVALEDGVHLLRVGAALVTVETTDQRGLPVEPITISDDEVTDESALVQKLRTARSTVPIQAAVSRVVLVCVEGPLAGQEFEVPPAGLVVGREGHVRVPDEFLSRKHFEVLRDEDGTVRVRDLGSRNGTFLNTLPARNTKVRGGDEIRAGVNRFVVEHRA